MVLYYDGDDSDDEIYEKEKLVQLLNISNPRTVIKNLEAYLGKPIKLYISNRKDKKYKIMNDKGKWVHFGAFDPPMQDYTYHNDSVRRENYLRRSRKIKGDWKNDKFSANNLARVGLWNAEF